MSDNNQRLRRYLATAAIYLAVAASVFGFNVIRSRAARQAAQPATPDQPTVVSTTPYFSLTTNRTYSPNETARLWASYQNIDYLDFRVYHVKDPSKFFKQLDDPHQMGEKEKEAVSQGYGVRVSVLERAHSLKISLFSAVKDYVRTHLLKEHRETFNQKFRKEDEPTRTPLNVADYARVPLLNPEQKVKDWREKLPALDHDYDSRMISLGKQDPGVYLIEAVNGGMRAYSIAIVTNLTMVQKTTKDGQVVVYVVDRKSGAPHEGVSVEVTRAKQTLANGATDKTGVFKAEIKPPQSSGQALEDVFSALEDADEGGLRGLVDAVPDPFELVNFLLLQRRLAGGLAFVAVCLREPQLVVIFRVVQVLFIAAHGVARDRKGHLLVLGVDQLPDRLFRQADLAGVQLERRRLALDLLDLGVGGLHVLTCDSLAARSAFRRRSCRSTSWRSASMRMSKVFVSTLSASALEIVFF